MTQEHPLYVTRPTVPPIDEFLRYVREMWRSRQLTNCGPFHERLERELAEYLGVGFVSLYSNGTIALIAALRTLSLRGEVITTPFSFPATAHALIWAGLTPVFVDIDAETFNLDPARVSATVTEDTSAILPVHCYGNPCDVIRMEEIADSHGLRVVYDAAHAFGVNYKGQSLLLHGDVAVLSFHATKVFGTLEGGAVVCQDPEIKERADRLRNFGFTDDGDVEVVGINGKLNELQAAFGLAQLPGVDESIEMRRKVDMRYRAELADIEGIQLMSPRRDVVSNFSYFPIRILDTFGVSRDKLYSQLVDRNIYVRRYFYPLIADLTCYRSSRRGPLHNAEVAARQILCLPIHPELESSDIVHVCDLIRQAGAV